MTGSSAIRVASALLLLAAAPSAYADQKLNLLRPRILAGSSLCETLNPAENFNATQFIQTPWYIQMMMPQKWHKKEDMTCSQMTFSRKHGAHAGDNKFGWDLDVHNPARLSAVKRKLQHIDQGDFTFGNLCVKTNIYEFDSPKMRMGSCKRPVRASQNFWILEHNPYEGYAVIASGQPDMVTKPFSNMRKCLYNNAEHQGIFIVTDTPYPETGTVVKARDVAWFKGLDTTWLEEVNHDFAKCPMYQRMKQFRGVDNPFLGPEYK